MTDKSKSCSPVPLVPYLNRSTRFKKLVNFLDKFSTYAKETNQSFDFYNVVPASQQLHSHYGKFKYFKLKCSNSDCNAHFSIFLKKRKDTQKAYTIHVPVYVHNHQIPTTPIQQNTYSIFKMQERTGDFFKFAKPAFKQNV